MTELPKLLGMTLPMPMLAASKLHAEISQPFRREAQSGMKSTPDFV